MKRLLRNRVLLLPVASLLVAWPAAAQMSNSVAPGNIEPPARKAVHLHITKGPALELFSNNEAIIRWTSNNPGGSDEHFGVVHYGTDPEHLSQMAKSHIRLNQNHSYTVFRVRVDGLQPQTTYYYTVDSTQATGKSDGVNSSVQHFTNP